MFLLFKPRRKRDDSKQCLIQNNRPVYKRSSWSKRTLKSDGSSTTDLELICDKVLAEKGMAKWHKRRRRNKKAMLSPNKPKGGFHESNSPNKNIDMRSGLTRKESSEKLKLIIQELLKECPSEKGTDKNSQVMKNYVGRDVFKENQVVQKRVEPIGVDVENIHSLYKVTATTAGANHPSRRLPSTDKAEVKLKNNMNVIESAHMFEEEKIDDKERDRNITYTACRYEMTEPNIFLSLKNDGRKKLRRPRATRDRGNVMTELNLVPSGSISSCSIDSAFDQALLPPPPPPPPKSGNLKVDRYEYDFIERIGESLSTWFGLCISGDKDTLDY